MHSDVKFRNRFSSEIRHQISTKSLRPWRPFESYWNRAATIFSCSPNLHLQTGLRINLWTSRRLQCKFTWSTLLVLSSEEFLHASFLQKFLKTLFFVCISTLSTLSIHLFNSITFWLMEFPSVQLHLFNFVRSISLTQLRSTKSTSFGTVSLSGLSCHLVSSSFGYAMYDIQLGHYITFSVGETAGSSSIPIYSSLKRTPCHISLKRILPIAKKSFLPDVLSHIGVTC